MGYYYYYVVLMMMVVWGSQRCDGFGTFGFNIHHRYSDPVKGILDLRGLLEKGSIDYYAAMAHRDLLFHGRKLAAVTSAPLTFVGGNDTYQLNALGQIMSMSMGSNIDTGYLQNQRCNCGKKAAVFISESEKNPGRLYFKCATRMCEYFGWGPASTENASDIQRKSKATYLKNEDERGYDYDVDKLNQIINRLERVEANQEAMKLFMFTAIVLIGFTMLIALLK